MRSFIDGVSRHRLVSPKNNDNTRFNSQFSGQPDKPVPSWILLQQEMAEVTTELYDVKLPPST